MATPLFKGPGTGDTQWQENFVLTENDQTTPLFEIELTTGNVTASGDVTVEGALNATASEATAALGLKSATTTVSVSSATAPTTGQILTATSGTAATWQAPSGSTPTGAAGGGLSGTYPNPAVASVGGSTAAAVNTATIAANAATEANTPNTIVKRDGSGEINVGFVYSKRYNLIPPSGAVDIIFDSGTFGSTGRLITEPNVVELQAQTGVDRFSVTTHGGTRLMNVESNGKVGIGVIPTTNKLEVNGDASATSFIGPLTGTADSTNALKSATTTVNVSSATAPSTGQVLTATGTTAATWQTPPISVIATGTFSSSSSVNITGLADGFDYELTIVGSQATAASHSLQLNSDTGTNYDWSGFYFAADGNSGQYSDSRTDATKVKLTRDNVANGEFFKHTINISSISGYSIVNSTGVFRFGVTNNSERTDTEAYYSASSLSTVQFFPSAGSVTGRWTLIRR
jgi:hypothetical protein